MARRGWMSLYAVALALLVGAGVAFGVSAKGFLESIGLLWVSIALSAAAIVVALTALVAPRRG